MFHLFQSLEAAARVFGASNVPGKISVLSERSSWPHWYRIFGLSSPSRKVTPCTRVALLQLLFECFYGPCCSGLTRIWHLPPFSGINTLLINVLCADLLVLQVFRCDGG